MKLGEETVMEYNVLPRQRLQVPQEGCDSRRSDALDLTIKTSFEKHNHFPIFMNIL